MKDEGGKETKSAARFQRAGPPVDPGVYAGLAGGTGPPLLARFSTAARADVKSASPVLGIMTAFRRPCAVSVMRRKRPRSFSRNSMLKCLRSTCTSFEAMTFSMVSLIAPVISKVHLKPGTIAKDFPPVHSINAVFHAPLRDRQYLLIGILPENSNLARFSFRLRAESPTAQSTVLHGVRHVLKGRQRRDQGTPGQDSCRVVPRRRSMGFCLGENHS